MLQRRYTISKYNDVDALRRGKDWFGVHDDSQKRFTTVVSTLGRDCRELPQWATNAEILTLVE